MAVRRIIYQVQQVNANSPFEVDISMEFSWKSKFSLKLLSIGTKSDPFP